MSRLDKDWSKARPLGRVALLGAAKGGEVVGLPWGLGLFNSLLQRLRRPWRMRSLSAKLLIANVVVILLSLLLSGAAYIGGSALARNRFLRHQIGTEADYVVEALNQRATAVSAAASFLANDSTALAAVREAAGDGAVMSALNKRMETVQDCFDLVLIQVYEHQGQMETELTVYGSSGESPLLNLTEPHEPVIRSIGGRLLLLSQAPMQESAGTVIAGIDLETELKRILATGRLPADLGLDFRGTYAATRPGLPFDSSGLPRPAHTWEQSVRVGSSSVELLVVRRTEDIERAANAGLLVMLGSSLLTIALLAGVNGMAAWSIAAPIGALSMAARAAVQDELDGRLGVKNGSFIADGEDEIGVLARSLDDLTTKLRELRANLEQETAARSAELTTVVEIARAFSPRLDLDTILQQSVQIIGTCLEASCPGVCHVGVFLVEPGADASVLKETASETERELHREHIRIPFGSKCPVGKAAATGRPQVIQNVKTEPVHLKPPLLMETYSAVAVPLLVEDTVVGVLDVQSREPGAFKPDIIRLLGVLSGQIASGVCNARRREQGPSGLKEQLDLCQRNDHLS
jgi:putative methionine-R-sulfoxide reductase with GAF domain